MGVRLPGRHDLPVALRPDRPGGPSEVRPEQETARAYLRVRTTARNPFGLFGMYAGSSEWCWDWYSPDYYLSATTAA